VARASARYAISDLSPTFGKAAQPAAVLHITRSRNGPEDVHRRRRRGVVNFRYSEKKLEIFNNIPVERARWIGSWLARLSENQFKDAFRAANYSSEETVILTEAVQDRIAELVKLGDEVRR